ADKEGFLRSETSLVQTIGRAARNINGTVIMYADRITNSMERAIDVTRRRREMQTEYNLTHNIEPQTIIKNIQKTMEVTRVAEVEVDYDIDKSLSLDEMLKQIARLERQMKAAAKTLEFEKAASLRDRIVELKKRIGDVDD
ncbi:MAG TPA: UvrB/UvrC motif-containing protein, partial [Bacillota bacterium]|nr:UvrB/UvrC motif-containing protein [Bacillota bacterium]